ncbi:hypothetical protein BHM03_00042355 [Ensete ventricosum]|nr:hypothetical protein BHM03_00042355 [Ensete ventricosum]
MPVGDRGIGSKQWCTNSSENCQEDTVVLKQVVKRGEEATMSPVELGYPKSKVSIIKEVDSEEHQSAAEADLPIAKEGMQMQGNR